MTCRPHLHPALAVMIAFAMPATSALAQTGGSDNRQIEREAVPEAVMKTAHYFAPGIDFSEYGIEVEDGQTVYEIGGYDPFGHHLEVDATPEGDLLEIEWETPLDELPVGVMEAFGTDHPDAKPIFAEQSIRPNGTIVFEIDGRMQDGVMIEFQIADTQSGLIRMADAAL